MCAKTDKDNVDKKTSPKSNFDDVYTNTDVDSVDTPLHQIKISNMYVSKAT